jgi:hypothetical protein
MLEVSSISGHAVTPAAVRMRRYRQGDAYQALLARERQERHARREAWATAKRKYKTMTFDGRESGPANPVGPLSGFGKKGQTSMLSMTQPVKAPPMQSAADDVPRAARITLQRRCFDCRKLFEQSVPAMGAAIVYRCPECSSTPVSHAR